MRQRLTAAAILCAALAGSLGAPSDIVWLALLMPLLACIVGPRLRLGLSLEAGASLAAAFLGILAARFLLEDPYRHDVSMLSERELLFMLPLLMVSGFRALLERPRFGARLTLVLGVLALTSAGGALTGPLFPALAAAFGVFGLAALASADPERRRGFDLRPRVLMGMALSALAVSVFAASSALLAPRLHAAVMDKIQQRMRAARVGFSSNLQLGDLQGMLLDSRVVLRVRGDRPPPLLRGAVFNEYLEGRWFSKRHIELKTLARMAAHSSSPSSLRQDGWYELEHSKRPERYFLPMGAASITTSSATYTKDEFRIVYPPDDSFAKRVWFRLDSRDAPRGPDVEDQRVPESIRQQISEVLVEWGASGGSEAERLDTIMSRLSAFHYSLTSERKTNADPVLDFLLENPEGHCEYFASAMVLLSRGAGVPARLVAGYRVVESSPFGYYIVRRQHAHSWVEVWLDNRWVTFDPTPAAELEAATPATTAWWPALVDAARTAWAASDDWLEQRTTFELALALLALGAAFITLRTLRARRQTRPTSTAQGEPLPGFLELDRRLAKLGLSRLPTETVACFIDRVRTHDELPERHREQIAALLEAYAVLRYAGRGDAQALDRSLTDVSRTL